MALRKVLSHSMGIETISALFLIQILSLHPCIYADAINNIVSLSIYPHNPCMRCPVENVVEKPFFWFTFKNPQFSFALNPISITAQKRKYIGAYNMQVTTECWAPRTHICGIVRKNATDHVITIPWVYLCPDAYLFADYKVIKLRSVAMQQRCMGNLEYADKSIRFAENISRWISQSRTDMPVANALLFEDCNLRERVRLGTLIADMDNVEQYADDLVAASDTLTQKYGTPPTMEHTFYFEVAGKNSNLFVTERLQISEICAGVLPVSVINSDLLDYLLAER